jgi:hypothetical protein
MLWNCILYVLSLLSNSSDFRLIIVISTCLIVIVHGNGTELQVQPLELPLPASCYYWKILFDDLYYYYILLELLSIYQKRLTFYSHIHNIFSLYKFINSKLCRNYMCIYMPLVFPLTPYGYLDCDHLNVFLLL